MNKKLLLLLPLASLSALGIVDLVDRALPTEPAIIECLPAPAPTPQPAPPLAVTAT